MTDDVTLGWLAEVTPSGEIKPENPPRFARALAQKRMVRKRVWLEISREKRIRSKAQNDRYFGLLIPAFCDWSGYEKDEAHELLKDRFLGIEDEVKGQRFRRVPSTASLTVEQFTEYQDRVERFLIEQGIQLPADERGRA